MGIENVYPVHELCINLVKLKVKLIKNPDIYDIFEKIKAFMSHHGKYKSEKRDCEYCVYHGN